MILGRFRGSGSIENVDRRIEAITGSSFGENELRTGWIDLNFAAKSQHLNVDGSIVNLIVENTACFQELIASENPLWSGHERHQ
jgi:hypothetical protein